MQADTVIASRKAPSQEEVSAKVLTELADILEANVQVFSEFEVIQALRDGAAALNLEVIRENQPLTLHTPIKYEGEYVA